MQIRELIASEHQQVQALEQQIRRQQEEFDELRHAGGGETVNDQIASMQEHLNKLEATVNALQTGAGPAGAPPGGPPAASPVATPSATGAPTGSAGAGPTWPADLDKALAERVSGPGAKPYGEGLQAMKAANYKVAVAKFELLRRRFPRSPHTEAGAYFEANALFELGNTDESTLKQSILQFSDLVMRYPKGRFAGTAMLRQAEGFLKLNDKIDARLTLQKLIADHPESPEAAAADTMLKDL
jgi:TolA-binding protein